MKVIVTKDSWGVTVWKDGTDLVYMKPFTKITTPDGGEIDVDSDKVWVKKRLFQIFRVLYKSKQVNKMFPKLNDQLQVGDITFAELDITPSK